MSSSIILYDRINKYSCNGRKYRKFIVLLLHQQQQMLEEQATSNLSESIVDTQDNHLFENQKQAVYSKTIANLELSEHLFQQFEEQTQQRQIQPQLLQRKQSPNMTFGKNLFRSLQKEYPKQKMTYDEENILEKQMTIDEILDQQQQKVQNERQKSQQKKFQEQKQNQLHSKCKKHKSGVSFVSKNQIEQNCQIKETQSIKKMPKKGNILKKANSTRTLCQQIAKKEDIQLDDFEKRKMNPSILNQSKKSSKQLGIFESQLIAYDLTSKQLKNSLKGDRQPYELGSRIIKNQNDDFKRNFIYINQFLTEIKHPNLPVYESLQIGQFSELRETIKKGYGFLSLKSFLDSSRLRKEEENYEIEKKLILFQMLKILNFLHKKGIRHRNISVSAFLVNEKLKVLLSYFESMQVVNVPNSPSFKRYSCFCSYRAPELLLQPSCLFTQKCDLWSLGCCVAYMLCGKHPFQESFESEVFIMIMKLLGQPPKHFFASLKFRQNTKRFLFPKMPARSFQKYFKCETDDQVKLSNLLKGVLAYQENKRQTAQALMESEYFDEIKNKQFYQKLKILYDVEEIFEFNQEELSPEARKKIVPQWYKHLQ